jgi:formate-dependent nitrite reductase cytochrome c552 subunit
MKKLKNLAKNNRQHVQYAICYAIASQTTYMHEPIEAVEKLKKVVAFGSSLH